MIQKYKKQLLIIGSAIAASIGLRLLGLEIAPIFAVPFLIGALDDFGIAFSNKTLRKFYEQAITPAVTNSDYEGEIKDFGDRLRILSFLHDISISSYSAGTDMSTQSLFDTSE